MREQPLRIAVANDYEIVVEGLAAMLQTFDDITTVPLTDPADVETHDRLDIVLYDTFGRDGIFGHQLEVLIAAPSVRHVAVFTLTWTDALTRSALERGVSGVLSKELDSGALAAGLRDIADGNVVVIPPGRTRARSSRRREWPGRTFALSERESEVLALLAQGLRNHEIAEMLGLSEDTVKTHLKRAYRKLGVRNRAQATSAVLSDPSFRGARRVTSDRSLKT